MTAALAAVWSGASKVAALFAFLAFWLGGVAEVVATPGAGAAEKIKGVGKARGAVVLGHVCFWILFFVFCMDIN